MPMQFPPCGHRREPRSRQIYHCRSPKLAGVKLVTAEDCQDCPFVDHPGADERLPSVLDLHPKMAVEQMATLLDGPVRSWPGGWEDWAITRQAHQRAADLFL